MGYRPHMSARNLARRHPDVIAAVIPMLTNMYFSELLRGLQDRVTELIDLDRIVEIVDPGLVTSTGESSAEGAT